MDIPPFLISEVESGNAVLLLGAGASREATDGKGNSPPSGDGLARFLADRFLGGELADYPLNQVSEYAISETDLATVQDSIRELFDPFQPADSHLLMTTFRWRCLATTNYDLILERAYEKSANAVQQLVPFIENGDRLDERLRGENAVEYIKLHGCVTRTNNPHCPLILTTDQYVQYREGRSRLFERFKDRACERTVVFVGYGMQDPNLRAILLELDKDLPSRPRYYIVSPTISDVEQRFWESKRITSIRCSFGEFFSAIDAQTSSTFRGLRKTTPAAELAIAEKFARPDAELTENCRTFLANDVDYVKGVRAVERVAPRAFYRGFCPLWSPIEQDLDVRRRLTDTVLVDHVLDENDDDGSVAFVVIKAHAGAGKSVFLQRLAWEASHVYNRLCLYLQPTGYIDSACLAEIYRQCNERIFLFVDDLCGRASEIGQTIQSTRAANVPLTIIGAARTNEWNTLSGSLPNYVSDEYELRYLSEPEIDQLLKLLEKHDALYRLEQLPFDQRRQEFIERAGRQLLVALHEATRGKPFEEIVCDEYKNITPARAQEIYLSVCVLFRLNVPVRAGIISRLYGVTFEDFKTQFLQPLEEVVCTLYDPVTKDYAYTARHPHIADILFEAILRSPERRFAEYLKGLQHLDIDYSADRKAFNQMIRGRNLQDMFPDHNMVMDIFAIAGQVAGDDAVLYHQMALYEINRDNGNLREAGRLLQKATDIAPGNSSIKHSMAELAFRNAREAATALQKDKHLDEATAICHQLKRTSRGTHPHHTLVKIGVYRLKLALEDDGGVTDSQIEEMLTEVEGALNVGLQINPEDSYLLSAEAELASVLTETTRAEKALAKAFDANPRNAFIASSLARIYQDSNRLDEARATVKRALEARNTDRRLHYRYGQLCMQIGDTSDDDLLYHFKRAYSPGDKNYDAQLLHARQVHILEGWQASRPLFEQLDNAYLPLATKRQIRYPLPELLHGRVSRLEATYCFIQIDGTGNRVYAHESGTKDELGRDIVSNTRVTFRVGFSMLGASAFDVVREKA